MNSRDKFSCKYYDDDIYHQQEKSKCYNGDRECKYNKQRFYNRVEHRQDKGEYDRCCKRIDGNMRR